jgi:hypothetical protein
MPHSEGTETPAVGIRSEDRPARLSRRSVLRGAAGAGAAGLAMTTLAGAALASPALAATGRDTRADLAAHGDESQAGEAVVVHVRDVRSGEMDVYRGTSHVRVQDRELAARLARASR